MKFSKNLYGLCRQIPKGRVSSYKVLAEKLNTKSYRAVGQALKRNPNPISTPCHRIVSSSGLIGGFKGKNSGKEIKEKIKLLEKEGVKIKNNKIIDFEKILYKFQNKIFKERNKRYAYE